VPIARITSGSAARDSSTAANPIPRACNHGMT
jgi:hypothetical protein